MIYICWGHQDKYGYYHKRTGDLASGEKSIIRHLLFQRLLPVPSKHAFYTFCERRVGGVFDFMGVAKNTKNIHNIFFLRWNKTLEFFEERKKPGSLYTYINKTRRTFQKKYIIKIRINAIKGRREIKSM